MSVRAVRRIGALLVLLCLAGCKVDLYNGLTEEDANQMLALLVLRGIEADKQMISGGTVTLRVDKSQFANAVEVLRQHGLPGKRTDTMADLFPSGQLVTSPAQEQAKILYLKEQQLEKMLRGMEGVVGAQVSIAESAGQQRHEPPILSAAVFIKYSPEVNLPDREADIRHLVFNGVPNLRPEKISVILQATAYRYQPVVPSRREAEGWIAWLSANRVWLMISSLVFASVLAVLALRRGGVSWWPVRR